MNGWGEKISPVFNNALKVVGFLLCLCLFQSVYSQSQEVLSTSWKNAQADKKGTIVIYWSSVKPFVHKNSANQMVGIEVELIRGFQEYLKSQHGIIINLKWHELSNFNEVYNTIKDSHERAVFGMASFSLLEDRMKHISFSPSYLKDISIIISNNVVPTVNSKDEFINTFSEMSAITLQNSTLEQNLLKVKKQHQMSFEISYVNTTDEVANYVSAPESRFFAYLDLPNYLSALNDGLSIKRHNYAPVIRDGYGIAYPLQSDWKEPLEEYFNRVSFQYQKDQIISKYLGMDVLNLIRHIDSDNYFSTSNEIGLLIKEKEIQERELNKALLESQKQESFRTLLILGLLFVAIAAGILFYNNYKKSIINKLLIQQQKQIEEQQEAIASQNVSLATSNKKLKKFNRQKNDLISILSHDLRAPINQIKGFAQIYKMENDKMSASQNDLIDGIISTSDRLTNMILKIMDVEAIDSNKLEVKMERTNLSQLLKKVTISFEEIARNKDISISSEFVEGDIFIEADQTYLTQVFENLISNAIKFSESNKDIEIKLLSSKDKIRAMVIDQGPGLTNEDQKRLFRKYQKLSATPTGGEQSTGLGLSIVKKYVKKMNGKVWAESLSGDGSTFIVEFKIVA